MEKSDLSSFEDETSSLAQGPDTEPATAIEPAGAPAAPLPSDNVVIAPAASDDVEWTFAAGDDDVGALPETVPDVQAAQVDEGAGFHGAVPEEPEHRGVEPPQDFELYPLATDQATAVPPAHTDVFSVAPELPAFDPPCDRDSDDTRADQHEMPQARDARPEPDADVADSGEAQNDIVVRTGWASPPPLTTQPSWVVREIAPDIVHPGATTASEETSGEVAPPLAARAEAADAMDPEGPEPEVDFAGWRQEVLQSRPAHEAVSVEAIPPDLAEDAAAERSETQALAAVSEPEPPAPSAPASPPIRLEPPPFARDRVAWTEPEPVDEASSPPSALPPLPPPNLQRAYAARTDVAYDDGAAPDTSHWDRAKDFGRTALRYAGYAVAGYFAFVFVLILLYRFVNPPFSSLMAVQAITGTSVQQEWVPLEDISPALVRAVIVSEDWSFCEHYGIDIKAIEEAIERSGSGIPRGASTISMQTTKNLFLWNAKSYIRKAVEVPLTLMIELIWPKWRILEIYLNVAEWGPGIFGAEAAAQYHFNKPASRLGEREAAQLAASLPNPIIREAGDPGPRTARKASVIQSRMRNAGGAANCVLPGGR